MPFDALSYAPDDMNNAALDELKRRNLVQTGDWVVLTRGKLERNAGGTNGLQILMVE